MKTNYHKQENEMLPTIVNEVFIENVKMHELWISTRKETNRSKKMEYIEKAFININLEGAILSDSLMSRCRFINCRFSNCQFVASNLMYTSFESCQILNCNLYKSDLHSINAVGLDLNHSSLERVDAYDANLIHANFSNCDLRGAQLIGTDLRYANLENVNLDYACIYRAKIYNLYKYKAASLDHLVIKENFADFGGSTLLNPDSEAISYLFSV